ncbi:hypothetical protein MSA03_15560 [Microbacterium saccharophilum]|nr:hypothetical protein MSA03_15560 [Microbacterium saccharophilum]
MPHTMHTIQDTESATHLAQQLLDAGRSVSLIARDTSHFAMLVNEYGDRFQTIPSAGTPSGTSKKLSHTPNPCTLRGTS